MTNFRWYAFLSSNLSTRRNNSVNKKKLTFTKLSKPITNIHNYPTLSAIQQFYSPYFILSRNKPNPIPHITTKQNKTKQTANTFPPDHHTARLLYLTLSPTELAAYIAPTYHYLKSVFIFSITNG